MKMRILAATLLAVGLLAGPARADDVVPPKVREAFRQATPEQRQAAVQTLREKYPDLPRELRQHLRQKYPNLPGAFLRAGLQVGKQRPGLPFGVARHLVKDLGGEPIQAFLDVGQAVQERYPDLPSRLWQLRRESRVTSRLEERHPGLRSDVIAAVRQNAPGLFAGLRETVLRVVRERHRGLGLAVLEEASRYLDEQPPEVREEIAAARAEGRRPLLAVAAKNPGLLRGLLARLEATQGEAVRSAAVDVLGELETSHGAAVNQAAGAVLQAVQEKHPGALADAWQMRAEAREAVRSKVRSEFPELPRIVARTMQEKHPRLLARAAESVERAYPDLRTEFQAAVEAELPGFGQEVRSFLAARYPDLEQDALRALQGQ